MKAEKLWNIKVYVREKLEKGYEDRLYNVRLYKSFRRALGDIINGNIEIFDNIPDEWLPKDFDKPLMINYGSEENNGRPDDFQIFYPIDDRLKLNVYLGKVIIEDKEGRVK